MPARLSRRAAANRQYNGRAEFREQAKDQMVQTTPRTSPGKRKRERNGDAGLPLPRLFSVDEYYVMAQAGILHPDERVELLEGVVVCKAKTSSREAACLSVLSQRLHLGLIDRASVRVRAPIHLSERSEPEPDFALVRLRVDRYGDAHPVPQDVYLLVEVSDTSLVSDRDHKLPLYATAGIPELWIVDLPRGRVFVYWSPRGDRYEQELVVGRGASVAPQAFPDLSVSVDELLGPSGSDTTQ